jgi:hypothetical protein
MEPSAEVGLESGGHARAVAPPAQSPSRSERRPQEAALMLAGLLVAELAWLALLVWFALSLF